MVTPNTNEIRQRAREIYFKDNPYFAADSHIPEDNELKEEGQWQAAAAELMSKQPMFTIDNTEAVNYIKKLANDLGMKLLTAEEESRKADTEQQLAKATILISSLQKSLEGVEAQNQQLQKIKVTTATATTTATPPKPSTSPINQAYNRTITVRFLVDCQKYHSSIDGREYGPYTAGQTAVIYEYDADILTHRGITSAVTSTVENINALWNNLKDAVLTGDDEQISLDTKKLKARNIQTKT